MAPSNKFSAPANRLASSLHRRDSPPGDRIISARPGTGQLPAALDQPLLLQPVQTGVERPLLPLKLPVCTFIDLPDDLIAVHHPLRQQPQYHRLRHPPHQIAVQHHDEPPPFNYICSKYTSEDKVFKYDEQFFEKNSGAERVRGTSGGGRGFQRGSGRTNSKRTPLAIIC